MNLKIHFYSDRICTRYCLRVAPFEPLYDFHHVQLENHFCFPDFESFSFYHKVKIDPGK